MLNFSGKDLVARIVKQRGQLQIEFGINPEQQSDDKRKASAMKSPVRFMARGLAEETGDEKVSEILRLSYASGRRRSCGGGECDGSGGGGRSTAGGSRQAPALRPAIIQ